MNRTLFLLKITKNDVNLKTFCTGLDGYSLGLILGFSAIRNNVAIESNIFEFALNCVLYTFQCYQIYDLRIDKVPVVRGSIFFGEGKVSRAFVYSVCLDFPAFFKYSIFFFFFFFGGWGGGGLHCRQTSVHILLTSQCMVRQGSHFLRQDKKCAHP